MSRIKQVEKTVEKVLREHPETRGDDFLLLLRVYIEYDCLIGDLEFETVMRLHNSLGLPPFESVRRARQKLQATYEELKAPERVRKGREKKIDEYIKYARS